MKIAFGVWQSAGYLYTLPNKSKKQQSTRSVCKYSFDILIHLRANVDTHNIASHLAPRGRRSIIISCVCEDKMKKRETSHFMSSVVLSNGSFCEWQSVQKRKHEWLKCHCLPRTSKKRQLGQEMTGSFASYLHSYIQTLRLSLM